MSDYDTFRDLMTQWQVPFTEFKENQDGGDLSIDIGPGWPVATFVFNEDRKFLRVGVWE